MLPSCVVYNITQNSSDEILVLQIFFFAAPLLSLDGVSEEFKKSLTNFK